MPTIQQLVRSRRIQIKKKTKSQVMIDSEGRVERFLKKYGLDSTT